MQSCLCVRQCSYSAHVSSALLPSPSLSFTTPPFRFFFVIAGKKWNLITESQKPLFILAQSNQWWWLTNYEQLPPTPHSHTSTHTHTLFPLACPSHPSLLPLTLMISPPKNSGTSAATATGWVYYSRSPPGDHDLGARQCVGLFYH